MMLIVACQPQQKAISFLPELTTQLEGSFNNFQQSWQENTQTTIHQVNAKEKHQHFHSIFKPLPSSTDKPALLLTHYTGRDTATIAGREVFQFWETDQNEVFSSRHNLASGVEPDLDKLQAPIETLQWQKKGEAFLASSDKDLSEIQIAVDTLTWLMKDGPFTHTEGQAYRLLRCRYFSGWIEYPIPEYPDSLYRMGKLTIHDQGGLIPLTLADGTQTDYSVELTQLVYGRQISIMKLAVYQEPYADIHYNSSAISYTWTNPKAKRIGINLRKIISGWTLIEPGYINSDNMKKK